jgi:hypothetical protein
MDMRSIALSENWKRQKGIGIEVQIAVYLSTMP